MTHNLTMVLGVVLSTFLRSRLALFVAITARYATDLVNIIDGFVSGPGGDTTVVLAVFTVVLPSWAVRAQATWGS